MSSYINFHEIMYSYAVNHFAHLQISLLGKMPRRLIIFIRNSFLLLLFHI
jgi:hypothetical protein